MSSIQLSQNQLHHMRRQLLTMWLGIFVAMLLVACGGDPEPTPEPLVLATLVAPEDIVVTEQPLPRLTDTSDPIAYPAASEEAAAADQSAETTGPTAVPSPTIDPNLPDWTLFVYMDADNNLEPYALSDWAEMQASTHNRRVNVVVQIDRAEGYAVDEANDWTEARRFVRSGDSAEFQFIEALGEVNMGDASTLADFVSWGVDAYPARQHALIMWGHGAGWYGISFDQSHEAARLSLDALENGIADGLAEQAIAQFDVIGFDSCLMGQIDVFNAVADYADYAVASEELIPGDGWNYTLLLDRLAVFSSINGAALSTQIIDSYTAHYQSINETSVTLSAVDLNQLDQLNASVDAFAQLLAMQIDVHADSISDARSGGQTYAQVFVDQQDRYGAIDLGRFASIVSQISPDADVRSAAQDVLLSVSQTVIADTRGVGVPFASGIATYFPKRAINLDGSYATIGSPAWATFLSAYHNLSVPAPKIDIISSPAATDTVNVQQPAWLAYEISGRLIDDVALLAGTYDENGRRQLLEYQALIPEPTDLPDGTILYEWRDGVHSDFFVWDTTVTWLTDSAVSEYVVMWSVDGTSSRYALPGIYQDAAGNPPRSASLIFDHATTQLVAIWGDEQGTPSEIQLQPGDSFAPTRYFLTLQGSIESEPGQPFALDTLRYEWKPLSDGDYFLGFAADSITGDRNNSFVDIQIDSSQIISDANGYLDPYLGFQFVYPSDWVRPIYNDTTNSLLYTSDPSGDSSFQIKLYQTGVLASEISAESVKTDVLTQWENVTVLYEDATTVGGELALRTAYGYLTDAGQRTGMFLTFVHDSIGYVLDLDMPTERETEMLAAVDQLIATWQWRPIGIGTDASNFDTVEQAGRTVSVPDDFTLSTVEGDWTRISNDDDGRIFIAFRSDDITGRDSAEVSTSWIDLASSGVSNIQVEQPIGYALGGYAWTRFDFTYITSDAESISGLLMTSVTDQERVMWAEAPTDQWDTFLETVLILGSAEFTTTP